jgi:SAM-dependent methyltransferase
MDGASTMNERAASEEQTIRDAVRERYARAATRGTSCCDGTSSPGVETVSCCGEPAIALSDGRPLPYDIAGSSLGCGAPIEAADLQPGDTVVDLGSGAGLDIFLAADRVGTAGRAIGVDMTPEMITKAQANAARLGITNAEFRLGEIEQLPLPDAGADVVISNCVINLLPDKRPAFVEAFRILRPGGRLVVSDIVSDRPLPQWMKNAQMWASCLGGAIPEQEYLAAIKEAGFADVEVLSRTAYAGRLLFSATIRARKPADA